MTNIKQATFIHVETGEYPLSLEAIRRKLKNVSFPAEPSVELLSSLGYEVVQAGEIPAGEGELVEGVPSLVDGVYYKTYTRSEVPPVDPAAALQAAKDTATQRVSTALARTLEGGYVHTAADQSQIQVQVRSQDRINLLGLLEQAKALEADTQSLPFRTTDNKTLQLNKPTLIAMITDALGYHTLVSDEAWGIKDTINAATTVAEVPAVPEKLVI